MEISLGKYKLSRRNLIISFFFLLLISNHLFGYLGHYGYDDLHYAELSYNLTKGQFDSGDHYSHRITILFATAISYVIFGVNDFASSLPALVLTIGIMMILINILKNESDEMLFLALSFTLLSGWFLFYSDKLMPDIYVAFGVMLALFAYFKVRFTKSKNQSFYSFLFAIALLFGFLSKGTIILVLPLIIYLFLTDTVLKRQRKFWIMSVLWGLVLFITYLLLTWIFTGSPFSRFQAIEDNAYISLCSYGDQPLGMLTDRILIGFYKLIAHQAVVFSFVFIVIFLINRMGLDIWRVDTSFSFFLTSSVVLLLSANFMSISLTSYSPMCLDIRHYLYLIPILAIPASRIVFHFSLRRHLGVTSLVVIVAVIIISEILNNTRHVELYALILLLFAIKFFIPTLIKSPMRFAVLFSVILIFPIIQSWNYAGMVNYRGQKADVKKLINQYDNTIFVTDDIQQRLASYFMGYQNVNGNEFRSFKDFIWDDSGKQKKILYNPYTSYYGKTEYPHYAEVLMEEEYLILQNPRTGIALYSFDYYPYYSVIYQFNNDFEGESEKYWDHVVTAEAMGKNDSLTMVNKFNVFSGIFHLDTLVNDKLQRDAIIQCKFDIKIEELCSPRLVVLLEHEGAEYHRDERLFDQHLKSVGSWYSITQQIHVSNDLLRDQSELSIYIWNPMDKEILLDNFKIELMTLKID